MKYTIILSALLLTGCGKLADTVNTSIDGYTIRCIEGTKFVIMSSAHGLAITPLVDEKGNPRTCSI